MNWNCLVFQCSGLFIDGFHLKLDIFISLLENVALGASAVQSSTYSSYGMANGAVDGNRDADEMLCTRTSLQNDPWWRVDLKKVYQIRRIIITNGGLETSGAEIRIGNGLTNNGNNNQL